MPSIKQQQIITALAFDRVCVCVLYVNLNLCMTVCIYVCVGEHTSSASCTYIPGRRGPCGWGREHWAQSGWVAWCRQREALWCQRPAGVCGSLTAGWEKGEEKAEEEGERGQRVKQGTGCWVHRPLSPCWAWSLCSRSPPRHHCSPSHSYAWKQK